MSKPYKTCPDCGDHLDPGERCDCEKEKRRHAAADVRSYAAAYSGKKATQERHQGNPSEPALKYGA